MNRKSLIFAVIGLFMTVVSVQVYAADAESAASKVSDKAFAFSVIAASSMFGMAIASSLCGLAQARAIAQAMEGIARQPSAYKDIQTLLIIGLALIESLALYVLVVALILFFGTGFTGFMAG